MRAKYLGAREIAGQQVGSKLHPVEVTLDTRREFLDGGGLGEPWSAFHQQVAVGEQGDEQAVHQDLLPQDALVDLFAQLPESGLYVRFRLRGHLGGLYGHG